MSEDYKKIALEDVKKGQRVRVVEQHSAHTATYEGVVLYSAPRWDEIYLGADEDGEMLSVGPGGDTDIFLLEDVPKPKVVSIETVTITRYDDGTEKTKTVSEGIPVSTRIETVAQFNAQEERLRGKILKDTDGDYWTCRNGRWCLQLQTDAPLGDWTPTPVEGFIKVYLPITIVENVGD